MWNKEDLLAAAQKQVKAARFTHIVGVIETSTQLAQQYGVDTDQAEVAAILHDFCKAWSPEQLKRVLLSQCDSSWLSYPTPTWHAPAARYVVSSELEINDIEILNAIYYHTTGRANMSPLERIIWVADYIEPNRNFPGVEIARELAQNDLNAALSFGLKQTIQHLLELGQQIHPLTIEAYNHYLK